MSETVTYTSAAGVTVSVSASIVSNPLAGLPVKPWHGGSAYWGKFPKAAAAGWASPGFFPIAVFYGKPSQTPALMALGVNTLMAAEHDGSTMASITDLGMFVLAQSEWTAAEIGTDPLVVGYHLADEIEMNEAYGNDAARLAALQKLATAARALGDGRFMQANFGNGVLNTFWAPGTMPEYLAAVDVSSVDKYAYTSPSVDSIFGQSSYWDGSNPDRAEAYGWQQDQMSSFSNATKPNWVFVETAMPYLTEAGARTITPAQIEGAVWNAIIHGAAGIAYFQHNNNATYGTYSLITGPAALLAKVKQINADIRSLAPVLNTPSLVWSFGAGLDTALKLYGGSTYIFAMTNGKTTGTQTFTVPAGLTGTVEVVGEARTLAIAGGKFTDTFPAEYSHHIYRIPLQ